VFTAPVSGFGRAADYYLAAGAVRVVEGIRLPALVIAAQDDPLIPVTPLERLRGCPSVELCITRHGGHVGFVGWRDSGRRWLDERIAAWVVGEA
jgi:predicted alpha/beta-fold hydrolase